MIPKVLHQIWIGPRPAPERAMASWRDAHPDWRYERWDDARIAAFGLRNRAAYDQSPEWCGKADVARYEILERHGGVFVDADSVCLRPLPEEILGHDAFACYEHEQIKPGLIANGYLGATRGNRLMRLVMHRIAQIRHFTAPAWVLTGPILFTEVASRYDGLHIYPSRMFLPRHHTGAQAPGDTEPVAAQHWGSTHGYDASLEGTPRSGCVTVIVPAYNAAPYIGEALSSVLAQGDVVARVVVVDDASTDTTRDAVRACGDSRVELVELAHNGGPAMARNVGFDRCTTDYVAFFDADDVMCPGALGRLACALDVHPDDAAAFGRLEGAIGPSGEALPGARYDYAPHARAVRLSASDLAIGLRPYGYTTLLYRSVAVRTVGGFDVLLHMAEDWDLAYRVARGVGALRFVDAPSLRYRVHGSNTCASLRDGRFETTPEMTLWYGRAMAKHGLVAGG